MVGRVGGCVGDGRGRVGGGVGCVCVSGCEGALLEVKAAVESGPVDPEEDGADEREEVGCHRGLVRGRLLGSGSWLGSEWGVN